jgi:hypothetical protein
MPIEMKGCWNKEVLTAVRTQLVEDYMNSIKANVGVYLVGWYPQCMWDLKDYRRNQVPSWDASQARAYFEKQAAEVSQETGKTIRAFVVDCGF